MRKLAIIAALAVVGCGDTNPTAPEFIPSEQSLEHQISTDLAGSYRPTEAPADFAVIYHEGLYHVFHIRDRGWQTGGGRVFGHATSPDLWNWTVHEDLDLKHPSWSPDHIWAPHIVLHDGVFYMYYTGVERLYEPRLQPKQAIGLATSTDLFNWELHNETGFLLDGTAPFTMYEEGGLYDMDCRDPMVFRHRGDWYMLITVKVRDPEKPRAIGVWTSKDLLSWTPVDYIRETTSSNLAESAFMYNHRGRLHLFWTDGGARRTDSFGIFGPHEPRTKLGIPGYANELIKVKSRILCAYLSRYGTIDFIDITDADFFAGGHGRPRNHPKR